MPTLGPINTPPRTARGTRMPASTYTLSPTDCATKAEERPATTAKSARKPWGTLQEPSINAPQLMAKVLHEEFVSIESVRKPLSTLQAGHVPSIDITECIATKAQGNAFVSLYDAAYFWTKNGPQTKQFHEAVRQCLSRGYTVPAIARHIRESACSDPIVQGEKLYTRIYHRIYNVVTARDTRMPATTYALPPTVCTTDLKVSAITM